MKIFPYVVSILMLSAFITVIGNDASAARDSDRSPWASLGGVITTDPTVIRNGDGRLEAFARGTDNAVWHIWQTAPNDGWSNWNSLGGTITSNIAVERIAADGRLWTFAPVVLIFLTHFCY
jgi:hypothetical protein